MKTYLKRIRARIKNKPSSVGLMVTRRCNLKCQMCDFWRNPKPEMGFGELRYVFGIFKKIGIKHIHLSGGEPMLREDIQWIVNMIRREGMTVSMTTNGTIPIKLEILKELKYIQFSIDSLNSKVHDKIRGKENSLKKTLSNLIKTKNLESTEIQISSTIQKDNYKDILKIIEFANENNIKVWLQPVLTNGFGAYHDDSLKQVDIASINKVLDKIIEYKNVGYPIISSTKFFEHTKKYFKGEEINYPCFAPFETLMIDSNGDVKFCCGIDKTMGNILEDDFNKIWNSEDYKTMRNLAMKGELEQCKRCCMPIARG